MATKTKATRTGLGNVQGEYLAIEAALASGQIRLRHVDGWRRISAVLSQRRTAA
jgi:hypothetical protein